MLRKMLSGALASICLWGFGLNTLSTEAATVCYTERNSAANSRRQYREQQTQQIQQAPTVNVGYIIVGDDTALLDDETMGYIRRMLNVKFPGNRYPAKRVSGESTGFQPGRRNMGDNYILAEAHDILSKEFEELERKYQVYPKRIIEDHSHKYGSNSSVGLAGSYDKIISAAASASGAGASANGSSWGIMPSISLGSKDEYRDRNITESIDSLGEDNSYSFFKHLSMLSKEDYVRFAQEAKAEGKSDYDYLIILNIHNFKQQIKDKYLGSNMWNDFNIAVKAIDIYSGEYIDRAEYRKRGYSTGSLWNSPSWRLGMRRAIIDSMIECFDRLPIGKYSVCDSPYCGKRQEELRAEATFGKVNRHCVKHCHDNDGCSDHMVDYAKDADLPSSYVNHRHKVD